MTNITTPAVYVGTCRKYNNGNLAGQWFELTDFDSRDEFYDACYQFHHDETSPELMFQDSEGCPAGVISEHHINWAFIDGFKTAQKNGTQPAFVAWVDYSGLCDYALFEDAYMGAFDNEQDYTHHYLDETGVLDGVPDSLLGYFDYDALSRDLFVCDFTFYNGFVFSNH